jgi:hypothetical protein
VLKTKQMWWRRPGAIALLWSGLCLGTLSLLAAHPAFALGIWSDAEPVSVAFYAAGALCFAGLGLLSFDTPATIRFLLHPVVLVCLALGAWSCLISLAAEFPLLSILGAPENSQGGLWYLMLAAFTAAAMVLRRNMLLFGSLVAATAAVALVAVVLNLSRIEWLYEWLADYVSFPSATLLRFNEYQAYYALALFAIAGVWLKRDRRALGWTLAAVALLVLLVSRNRAAMAAAAAVGIVAVLARALPALRPWLQRPSRQANAIVGGVLLLAAIGPYLIIRLTSLQETARTLWSRQVMFKGIEPSLFDPVYSALLGHGWGHYGEYLLRDLPSAGVRLFDSEWQGLTRDLFHSHNAALEAFFAAGLPGLILALAVPIALALTAQARWREIALAFALSWTVIDAFWFMMPVTMVALALAIGLLAESSRRLRLRLPAAMPVAACLVLALASGAAAAALLQNARAMSRLAGCLPPAAFRPDCHGVSVPGDPRGTGIGLASLLGDAVPAAIKTKDKIPAEQLELLQQTIREAQRRAAAGGSLYVSMALINDYAAAAFTPDGTRVLPAPDSLAQVWLHEIAHVLDRAPQRLDVLPAYLNWLLLDHRHADMQAMLARAAAVDRDHPVVLWFSGVLLIEEPDVAIKQRGLALMRRALAQGVERFMPVDASIKSALGRGVAAR